MVEWKKLGEVASYYRGVTYNKKQEVSSDSGGTKILRANNITLDSNSLNFDDVKEISSSVKIKDYQWLYANDILICAGSGSKEHVGKVAFIEKDIDYAYGGFMGKLVSSNSIHPRFFFHVISSELFKKYLDVALNSTTINNLNSTIINEFLIPVPPLSTQSHIVSILDTFTSSISNLKQQIEERRKQYEYERDLLLDLEGKEGVEMKKLGEVCKLERGVRVVKKDLQKEGVLPVYQNSLTPLGYYDKSNYPENTTFVICAGAAGEVGFSNKAFWAADDCYYFECSDVLMSRYLYYVLQNMHQYIISRVRKASVPRLSKTVLEKMTITIPEISEQARIVSILDRFDTLCNDISEGLPAEIEARRKQYEYYRDKLLTFKEKTA